MRWLLAPQVAWHQSEDTVFLVSLTNTNIAVLDPWAARVWALLLDGRSTGDAAAVLAAESGAAVGQVQEDVEAFVGLVESGGYLRRGPGTPEPNVRMAENDG